MQDLINIKELTTDALTEKVVEMVQELQRRVNGEVAATSTETVEETTATVAETEIIDHDGLKLRKVDREAREGDYIRQTSKTDSDHIFLNVIYGPVEKNRIKDTHGTTWSVYNGIVNRTPSTVEVFEVIDVQAEQLPFPEVELTANQKRAALIEKAKKFVEEHGKNFLFATFENTTIVAHNVKKRLLSHAKCAPGDVFNEWIGKAIALARALEIDVPEEFLKSVQPDIAIGQKFKSNYFDDLEGTITDWCPDHDFHYNGKGKAFRHTCDKGWLYSTRVTILDDTNAQYEVTK